MRRLRRERTVRCRQADRRVEKPRVEVEPTALRWLQRLSGGWFVEQRSAEKRSNGPYYRWDTTAVTDGRGGQLPRCASCAFEGLAD
ncbi:hypothetical protein C493_00915 [Natronolimnohabitans innermongolicus JCM 12255]|uniref:Uncharacterized protein n=1 Tax=Natronolimnohabitans innermongolicus JCM 12255 TaxID=1227499 RepID=L9XKP1_9EURY|nr:hypothetical protein C493_00915 [Natronolimnohabitans innermongolicus JCM 12255]